MEVGLLVAGVEVGPLTVAVELGLVGVLTGGAMVGVIEGVRVGVGVLVNVATGNGGQTCRRIVKG